MRFNTILISVILLAGCAEQQGTTGQPFLASDVLIVQGQKETEKYWTLDTSSVRFGGGPQAGGCATFETIIDSNGKVFVLKLLETEGPHGFDQWALRVISNERFKPVAGNPNRTPVQTVLGWWITMRGDRKNFMNGCETELGQTQS